MEGDGTGDNKKHRVSRLKQKEKKTVQGRKDVSQNPKVGEGA